MLILIVEDDVTAVTVMRMTLIRAGHEVKVSRNGAQAKEALKEKVYDVVVTDWMMPEHDGEDLIYWIHSSCTTVPYIIMVTALDLDEARQKAMRAGAHEYLTKPLRPEDLLVAVDRAPGRAHKSVGMGATRVQGMQPGYWGIAVGAGTGGAEAVARILSGLGDLHQGALFIAVHGPLWATEALASQLNAASGIPVTVAADNMQIVSGTAYLAPGDHHMVIVPETMRIRLTTTEPVNFVRPSLDPLFRSVAVAFGVRSIGIVLGGASLDGAIGSGYIRAAGGLVIAQSPGDAVVDQMPQNVINLGISGEVIDLDQIAYRVQMFMRESSRQAIHP
jgi:two-component system, chemotaxis family, protein-glutamate methylesterase/glutaminase